MQPPRRCSASSRPGVPGERSGRPGVIEVIDLGLDGKAALVTGAGSGIGLEIARWLARAGCSVAVNDIDVDLAAMGSAAVEAEGRRSLTVVADVTDEEDVGAMLDATVAGLGGVDVAVNNVGMNAGRRPVASSQLSSEYLRDVVDQNLVSTALCAAAEARAMIDGGGGGVILNVSSGETTRPSPTMAAYGAAKAAVNHLTRTLADELGPHGIRVCAIAPGTTLTETVRAAFSEEHIDAIVASTPLRRMTEPDELGRLAVLLASDLARCVTGQLVLADAGAFLSRSRPGLR